jgi:regulator of sirC expression with transglutaminase-like and TPR domain
LRPADLAPVGKRAILVRMLHNLRNMAQKEGDAVAFLRCQDAIVTVAPDWADERLMRAGARFQSGDKQGALADIDWLLEHNPPGLDRERVLELRRFVNKSE